MKKSEDHERADQQSDEEHVSHYAKYKGAHIKYQNSQKGKEARARYMTSERGKSARRRYQQKRNQEIKDILKSVRESGARQ